MDKVYNHKEVEERIYRKWKKSGYFKPEVNPQGKPYCIILPPPNANGALHFGNAMFTVEDILIRYHRMKGYQALWLPGTDHAGIETQFVFEKKLKKEGKSRLDFDRETLYKMIYEYVEEHRGGIEKQLKRLGFSLDWAREKYTLDPEIVKFVYKTFKKMYDDGLVYRDYKLVNYCTFDGTSFSDLEVKDLKVDAERGLYTIKYPLVEGGFIKVATTRPETMFGDVAIMVNPDDSKYKNQIGKKAKVPLIDRDIPIIADEHVDRAFGTGAVKLTPMHDFNDYEVAKKHGLINAPVILGLDGKIKDTGTKYDGFRIVQARLEIEKDLREKNLFVGVVKHKMVLKTCYKCGKTLEPLPLEQWFIKTRSLAERAIKVVKEGKIKVIPSNFETMYFQWLENLRDWNISRQIVWGIRIPAWKCQSCKIKNQKSKIKNTIKNSKVNNNLTMKQFNNSGWIVTTGEKPERCLKCNSTNLEQDPDTFDTWFSSSQWPFATLRASPYKGDFEKFYPTTVMETGYDLLKAWVSRMVMMGLYATDKVPFKTVLFHGLVNDPYGKKMSKSKGNVINPLELIDQYGADAVRFALVFGNATGNDQSLSYPKLDAARKFTNKIWNIARFIIMKRETRNSKLETRNNLTMKQLNNIAQHENDKSMIKKTEVLTQEVTKDLDEYNFNYAAERLYDFAWHEFADKYIEKVKSQKSKVKSSNESSFIILNSLFLIILKLLHPFMPFITEEIYQKLVWRSEIPLRGRESIMISDWPI